MRNNSRMVCNTHSSSSGKEVKNLAERKNGANDFFLSDN